MAISKTVINLHHTAMYAEDDIKEQFNAVNSSHRKRWNGKTLSKMGFYGGYHYIVERNGETQQFRKDDEVGAHNDKGLKRIGGWMYSANYYAIGITFAGNMSRQQLTGEQIKAGVELVKRLQDRHDISDENVLPHRHYKPTQCPGNNIPDNAWDFLLEQYEKLHVKESPIVKWNKKHKLIEKWGNPSSKEEERDGWMLYKLGKAIVNGKLKKEDFNL